MIPMSTKPLVLLAVLASCAVLRAEPLDQRQIAADAKWLAHLDLDALRDAPSAKVLVAAWLQTEPARGHLAGIQKAVGLDVVRDLRSITLFGDELVTDRGVLVVRAPLDKARVTEFLARQPGYAEQKHDGREVLTWTERRAGQTHTVFGAMLGRECIVFSRDVGDLTTALEMLDGKTAHLGESDSPLQGPAPEGTVLLVRASGLSEAKLALKSPILRLSETIDLTAGEDGAGTAFVEIRLTAASAEFVPHFHDVANGLVALARLMRANDKDVLRLLDAITISTDERTVSARWSGHLADILQAVGNERLRTQYD
jgi:hypothetical protein